MNTEQKLRTLVNGQQLTGQQSIYGLAASQLTRLTAGLLFISRLLGVAVVSAFLLGDAAAQTPTAGASGGPKANCDNQIR